MELTKVERLMLSNQFKILEKLYPEEKEFYEVDRKAIEEGYVIHYDEILQRFINEEELTEESSREVLDILSMYRSMIYSCRGLSEEEKKEVNNGCQIKFKGFDGNDPYEAKLLMYTRYFIMDKDRFQELVDNKDYPDFNSHSPMLARYKKMLQLYNSFNKQELTKDRINELLGIY